MEVCSYTNFVVASALFTAVAFAGCASQETPPAETPAGETVTADPEPEPLPGMEPNEAAEEPDDVVGDDDPGEVEAPSVEEDGETRTTKEIQKVILANREPIRACYEKVQKSLPTLRGTMTIHFVLDPEGKVKKAELNHDRSTLKSNKIAECAIAELKKLKFPPSSRGMESTVNYPFDFNP